MMNITERYKHKHKTDCLRRVGETCHEALILDASEERRVPVHHSQSVWHP